jgi:hypothetical protein
MVASTRMYQETATEIVRPVTFTTGRVRVASLQNRVWHTEVKTRGTKAFVFLVV